MILKGPPGFPGPLIWPQPWRGAVIGCPASPRSGGWQGALQSEAKSLFELAVGAANSTFQGQKGGCAVGDGGLETIRDPLCWARDGSRDPKTMCGLCQTGASRGPSLGLSFLLDEMSLLDERLPQDPFRPKVLTVFATAPLEVVSYKCLRM